MHRFLDTSRLQRACLEGAKGWAGKLQLQEREGERSEWERGRGAPTGSPSFPSLFSVGCEGLEPGAFCFLPAAVASGLAGSGVICLVQAVQVVLPVGMGVWDKPLDSPAWRTWRPDRQEKEGERGRKLHLHCRHDLSLVHQASTTKKTYTP